MMTFRTICLTLVLSAIAHAADFKTPILLTSGGQSADPQLVKTLLTRENIAFDYAPLATAASLEGKGTLLIVLGGSSKGLGAAKISAEQESARISALLKAAKEKKIPVLAMHIGGKNRRGALSDEFNRIGAAGADEVIVVTGGNEDGLFTTIASEHKTTIREAAKIADLGPMLREKFVPAPTEPKQ